MKSVRVGSDLDLLHENNRVNNGFWPNCALSQDSVQRPSQILCHICAIAMESICRSPLIDRVAFHSSALVIRDVHQWPMHHKL